MMKIENREWSGKKQGPGSGPQFSGNDGTMFSACARCGGVKPGYDAEKTFNKEAIGHKPNCQPPKLTVWKFQLGELTALRDSIDLQMPDGAQLLSVQDQQGVLTLWALVDASHPMVPRKFAIVGTGHRVPAGNLTYIGTAQMAGGALVWHLFEVHAD